MRRKLIVLSVLFLSLDLLAKHVVLFTDEGKYVGGYAQKVESLAVGDTVDFGGGKSFQVQKILGKGSNSLVFAINDEKAIRISRYSGRLPELRDVSYADLLQGFFDQNDLLKNKGVSVVDVFKDESKPRQFVMVENLDIAFTYTDLIAGLASFTSQSDKVKHKAMEDFVKFARGLALFRTIGDQHSGQIGYVPGRGWVLFDYTHYNTSLAGTVEDASPFVADAAMRGAAHGALIHDHNLAFGDQRLPLPKEIRARVLDELTKVRMENGLPHKETCFKIVGKFVRKIVPVLKNALRGPHNK